MLIGGMVADKAGTSGQNAPVCMSFLSDKLIWGCYGRSMSEILQPALAFDKTSA